MKGAGKSRRFNGFLESRRKVMRIYNKKAQNRDVAQIGSLLLKKFKII